MSRTEPWTVCRIVAGGGSDQSADEYDEAGAREDMVRLAECVQDRLQVRQPDALYVPAAASAARLQLPSRPTGYPPNNTHTPVMGN